MLLVRDGARPTEVQVTVESDAGSTEGSQIRAIVNLTCVAINEALAQPSFEWSELDTFEHRRDDFCCGETTDPFVQRATCLWDYVYKAVAARIFGEVAQ
jgi:hypothetical protein